MKVLTVRQPHASLIAAGAKPVDNRTWKPAGSLPQWKRCTGCGERDTELDDDPDCGRVANDGPFPFRLAIHAAAKHHNNEFRRALSAARYDPEARAWIHAWWENRDAGYGVVLCTVEVAGCHHADDCRWYERAVPERPGFARLEGVHYCSPCAEPDVYHWTFADPQPCEQVAMRGRQGLWDLPPSYTPRWGLPEVSA